MARQRQCPVHDRPRYRLRWYLRDAGRTVNFTIRCRPARYFGWGVLPIAAFEAAVALAYSSAFLGWIAAGTAIVSATLLLIDAFRGLR